MRVFCYLFFLIIDFQCISKCNGFEYEYINNLYKKNFFYNIYEYENCHTINGSIGIITKNKSYNFGDTIKIYDANLMIKSVFIWTDECQVFFFPCIDKTHKYYKVILDNDEIGYIPKNSKQVIFRTWKDHIIKDVSFVKFDGLANPIMKKPNKKSEILDYNNEEFYQPIKIRGDWLEIKFGDNKCGWIKWRNNCNLIIEFFYFA